MKILVNTPSMKLLGGVSNHYLGLRDYWTAKVRYNTVGARSKKKGTGIYWLPWDLLKFVFRLFIFRPDIVLINPSLRKTALNRDFIFLKIANFLGFKVIVFIHGFDWNYAKVIDRLWAVRNFNKASMIIVLAQAFVNELKHWGVTVPIVLSTTKVDDKLLKGYDPIAERSGKVKNILFLARVEKEKGIYITIDTFRLLKSKYPFLKLTIVGDGSELLNAKTYVLENAISDVEFTGRLFGEKIAEAYKNADLYSFCSYQEGMPTSVLEAMAFGLPVITTKVGGLPDFFENKKMGYITDSYNPIDFANEMELYINDKCLTKKVSDYNAKYAKEHFMASNVSHQLENYFKSLITSRN